MSGAEVKAQVEGDLLATGCESSLAALSTCVVLTREEAAKVRYVLDWYDDGMTYPIDTAAGDGMAEVVALLTPESGE